MVRRHPFDRDQIRVVHQETRERVAAVRFTVDAHGFPVEGTVSRSEIGERPSKLVATPAQKMRSDARDNSVKGLIERYGHFDLSTIAADVTPLALPIPQGAPIKMPEEAPVQLITVFQAKLHLADLFGRPLTVEESAALDSHAIEGSLDERFLAEMFTSSRANRQAVAS